MLLAVKADAEVSVVETSVIRGRLSHLGAHRVGRDQKLMRRDPKPSDHCRTPPSRVVEPSALISHSVQDEIRRSEPPASDPKRPSAGAGPTYWMRVRTSNIGRYMAMMMTPTTSPIAIIITGSITDVSDWIEASTSSS